MQILLTVSYDGTRYAGWQRQKNGLAVQQVLEDTLAALLGYPAALRAASRTDAGVHALGQKAAFFLPPDTAGGVHGAASDGGTPFKIPLDKLPRVLCGRLPRDVAVTAAAFAPDDFNPRFRARHKTYRYQIHNAPCPDPLLRRYSAFEPRKLDTAAMAESASFFMGRHDFKAFQNAAEGNTDSTVREIYACEVSEEGPLITLRVTGNGFLYNMVRIMAGTALYAGLGRIKPAEVPDILAGRDRARAGATLPPEGLTLMEVAYDLPALYNARAQLI